MYNISGSFLRKTCQTLNASKSERNWTPSRGEVDIFTCLGREPEPPFVPRARTFFGAHPVVPLDPEKSCLGALVPRRGIVAEFSLKHHPSPSICVLLFHSENTSGARGGAGGVLLRPLSSLASSAVTSDIDARRNPSSVFCSISAAAFSARYSSRVSTSV